jgi:hypothetical protein
MARGRAVTKLNREQISPLSLSTEADMRLYFEDNGGTGGSSPFESLLARAAFAPIKRLDGFWLPPRRTSKGLDFSHAQPPCYVKPPAHQAHYTEPDGEQDRRETETAERRARIGEQLGIADVRWERRGTPGPKPSEVMELFFGSREQPWRKGLGKYSNLVEHTAAFAEAYAESGTTRIETDWLARLAEKARKRKGTRAEVIAIDAQVKRLHDAGEKLLLAAERAYQDASRELPRRRNAKPFLPG